MSYDPDCFCVPLCPSSPNVYSFISESKEWSKAEDYSYCREHYTDLATIENDQENGQVMSLLSAGGYGWIGLYREPWRWSDNSSSSFRNWGTGQPNNYDNQFCVAEESNHLWFDEKCDKEMPFWCHALKVRK
uniref:C-type lectin domain-containing protein n=1 Tax=Stegastes partitus TaxID=144197 RepID=A0A3B4Z4H9_9TELE